jgi:hypothetical protein
LAGCLAGFINLGYYFGWGMLIKMVGNMLGYYLAGLFT